MAEFTPSSFRRDFLKLDLLQDCAFHRPLQLRPIRNSEHYKQFKAADFSTLPRCYPRFALKFELLETRPDVLDRFVQLLAPLTLYHFSQSSKELYFYCLDLRGLEYKCVQFFQSRNHTFLEGVEGMRYGYVTDRRFSRFQICNTALKTSLRDFRIDKVGLAFVKRHKVLRLTIQNEVFHRPIDRFLTAVFCPAVKHVAVYFDTRTQGLQSITLKNLEKLLRKCLRVQTMFLSFDFELFIQFAAIKAMIEEWAVGARKLETFILRHTAYYFQLEANLLKRCCKIFGSWYWTDNCDVQENVYEWNVSSDISDIMREIQTYTAPHRYSHYDDILHGPGQLAGPLAEYLKQYFEKNKAVLGGIGARKPKQRVEKILMM